MAGTHALMTGSSKRRTHFIRISSDAYDVSVAGYAATNGWDSSSPLCIVVDSDVVVGATTASSFGIRINGSYPNGLTILNYGSIVGAGGAGGVGVEGDAFPLGTAPGAGGTALCVSSPVAIKNIGCILGGGGGGSGGGCRRTGTSKSGFCRWGGNGGGGGQGQCGGLGAAGGCGLRNSTYCSLYDGVSGAAGSYAAPGAGGVSACNYCGGNGGTWGSSGSTGCFAYYPFGGAGNAVCGDTCVTWLETGIRCGTIT